MAAARSGRHVSARLPTAERAGKRGALAGRALRAQLPLAVGDIPGPEGRPSFRRRSTYETVFCCTNRWRSGSHAAGLYRSLLVLGLVELVVEFVVKRIVHLRWRLVPRQVLPDDVHPGRGR